MFRFEEAYTTKNNPFYANSQRKIIIHKNLQLMKNSVSIEQYKLFETNNFRFLKIPFDTSFRYWRSELVKPGNLFYTIIALPTNDGDTNGNYKNCNDNLHTSILPNEFEQAINLFSSKNSNMYQKYLKSRFNDYGKSPYSVKLFLPKLTVKSETLRLKKVLKQLNMNVPFDELNADFTKFFGNGTECFINNVYHQTFFKMCERGVEAAAATAVTMMGRNSAGSPLKTKKILYKVDHPFYLALMAEDNITSQPKMIFVGYIKTIQKTEQ